MVTLFPVPDGKVYEPLSASLRGSSSAYFLRFYYSGGTWSGAWCSMSNGGMSQNYTYDLTTPIVCDGYIGFSDWSDSAIRLWAKKGCTVCFPWYVMSNDTRAYSKHYEAGQEIFVYAVGTTNPNLITILPD